ncbi:unnamed protein product [Clavelina lepadiformis]|uniref:protein-histidine N-methyltransferase n=1 Tax=Clavelina lepadiformis TaxID=159417 RepID=A0ABP0GII2_CLALP
MGKKSRAKQSAKTLTTINKNKKELTKLAVKLFKMCIYSPSHQEEWDYYLKIHSAVENFRKRHVDGINYVSSTTDKRNLSLPVFKTWLFENGVEQNFVKLHDFEDIKEFGLIATEDIKIDQSIVTVPRQLMITHEDVKTSYLKDLIAGNEVLSVMPNVCLALFLHFEKYNPESKYKPYLDILPREFNTTLYFTPEEMKYLRGSTALSSAVQQYKSIVRQFTLLYQVFNGNHQQNDVACLNAAGREMFTFDAYRWCVSAVTTRQNKIPALKPENADDEDGLSTLAMIPLWDMFNHDIGPMSTAYNAQTNQLECFAMRDFAKDEQVTICYGGRCNSDLLIHNGFVFSNNPFDKVRIRLGISTQDPLYKKKVQLLSRVKCEANGLFAICSMNGNLPTSPQLLSFLRVFHMNEGELNEWIAKSDTELNYLSEVYISGPVHFSADIKMWEYLENRVNLLLLQFKKNFEDVETLLRNDTISSRAKLSLKLRIEEQRVLTECAGFCRQFRLDLQQKSSNILSNCDSDTSRTEVEALSRIAFEDPKMVNMKLVGAELAKHDSMSTHLQNLELNSSGNVGEKSMDSTEEVRSASEATENV